MSEIANLINTLRALRDIADKERAAAGLHFLITQALNEALLVAQRRELPIPPEANPTKH
ncbi:hypothetical protein QTL95_24590 [Rhizobium sp. S152]|uniref:hypothetical protein n=1 Tax=Rhizobium sp. S152 TaxID=3055038 RepID=UPI0025A9974B|nr:hypothetical protein [Rhizobium sp. S152]MDM9629072.1 hypothetical protein [Rhizobium sp. S152]